MRSVPQRRTRKTICLHHSHRLRSKRFYSKSTNNLGKHPWQRSFLSVVWTTDPILSAGKILRHGRRLQNSPHLQKNLRWYQHTNSSIQTTHGEKGIFPNKRLLLRWILRLCPMSSEPSTLLCNHNPRGLQRIPKQGIHMYLLSSADKMLYRQATL